MHMLQKHIQMIDEVDENWNDSQDEYPVVTPDVPKRFTVFHNKEEEEEQLKKIFKKPLNSSSSSNWNPFEASPTKYLIINEDDKDKIYDVSQNQLESTVRLKDINFAESSESQLETFQINKASSNNEGLDESKVGYQDESSNQHKSKKSNKNKKVFLCLTM